MLFMAQSKCSRHSYLYITGIEANLPSIAPQCRSVAGLNAWHHTTGVRSPLAAGTACASGGVLAGTRAPLSDSTAGEVATHGGLLSSPAGRTQPPDTRDAEGQRPA